MRFKGKVSWWFYAIIIGVAILLIPLIMISALTDPNTAALTLTLAVFISIESFSIPIAVHNYVELQDEALLIVFGLIKKKIPYNAIAALSPTNNPSSSLAASLDRIEIKCRNRETVMIAVVDKERFFHAFRAVGK